VALYDTRVAARNCVQIVTATTNQAMRHMMGARTITLNLPTHTAKQLLLSILQAADNGANDSACTCTLMQQQ
jgi:hypothetical protein